jgi:hypothetical protein
MAQRQISPSYITPAPPFKLLLTSSASASFSLSRHPNWRETNKGWHSPENTLMMSPSGIHGNEPANIRTWASESHTSHTLKPSSCSNEQERALCAETDEPGKRDGLSWVLLLFRKVYECAAFSNKTTINVVLYLVR